MSLTTAPNLKGRTRELDFVRGIAILMVMAFHFEQAPESHPILRALQMPGKWIGQTGVDVFFVLSGFLVGGLLLKEYKDSGKVAAGRFLLRRGLKIWPAYYFYILAEIIYRKHPLNTFLVPNLLHLQNYLGTSILHTWTLSLEEHFYLLLAIAMGIFAARKWPAERILRFFWWTIAAVIGIRCLTVAMGWPGAWEYTHDRLDSLLFGVVLATLFHFFPERFEQIAAKKWTLAGVLAFAVAFHCVVKDERILHSVGFTILYVSYGALLLLVFRHSGNMKESRIYKWVASVGLYSYGIYLWHNSVRAPLVHLSARYPEVIRWELLMVTEFATAILVGTLTTLLIEWPFLRLRDRIFPQKGAALFAADETCRPGAKAEEMPAAVAAPQGLPQGLENA